MPTILSKIPWPAVTREIRDETRNRECHQPLVSVYRWWARRPHALIGAVLDAAGGCLKKDVLIADPFSGGGTVAIEATRRSLNVYAQDVNPWASWGLRVSLTPVDPDELAAAGDVFLQKVRNRFASVYGAIRNGNESHSQVHTFRVRKSLCAGCRQKVWMFPYPLVTLASRAKDEGYGFFGCRACGSVSRQLLDAEKQRCSICNCCYEAVGSDRCPHCRSLLANNESDEDRSWSVVLVQRRIENTGNSRVAFWPPSEEDIALAMQESKLPRPSCLEQRIPLGNETAKLLRFGFATWADLYPERQVGVLLAAARELSQMKIDERIRDRLMLCIAGATEMPGHICRWDRFNPKVFEGLANHRYSFDGLAVEPNPLGLVGRGTLARRISASVVAACWLAANASPRHNIAYRRSDSGRQNTAGGQGVTVVIGSSERILLRDKSVSLILTDPPYFDSVHYGELSWLFLAWTPAFGIARRAGRFFERQEAIPKTNSWRSEMEYVTKLRAIFRECARVLKDDGKLVLTFHSRNLHAWSALARALGANGFKIVALATVETENSADHAKRGKNSFISDLVIECRRASARHIISMYGRARTPEQRELVHVGSAIAEVSDGTYSALRETFLKRVARMQKRKIVAPKTKEAVQT